MLSPSPGGASRALIFPRSQVKSREYRALAKASLWVWGVSQCRRVGCQARYGSPAPRATWHQWRSPLAGICRLGHSGSPGGQRRDIRPRADPGPRQACVWLRSALPPEEPGAHRDPPGDSPLQALRWHQQQPGCRMDLGPAGHSSHLLGLPLDREGRERGELCWGMGTSHIHWAERSRLWSLGALRASPCFTSSLAGQLRQTLPL